jgi:hypothetical protein
MDSKFVECFVDGGLVEVYTGADFNEVNAMSKKPAQSG